ncbi:enoyl-CoA hydratase/isomerase family protein [Planosporangium mesophilum]|uniref:enoyl-CoA hydratase/isomerase family protein n=1 Tax=Planosporangium mesophilum TaxID=689768 RepID=UPI00194F0D54|nr:enoyl-CoA hydratase/isomerase family protein [Planosporangium mesophilum]
MNGTLKVEDGPDRVLVRLDRPQVRNAIDAAMVADLHEVCADLERQPRILVITGADGIFAGGADIRELRERRREDALAGINSGLFDRIAKLPMPTIAAVDGPALGGGAELAYACDFRIATPRARFGNPEAGLGIMAAAGACWRLRELVGEPLAKEILLAGRMVSAEEALAVRLVNELVAEDELLAAADGLVSRIARNAPLALRLTKLALAAPPGAHPRFDDVAQAVLFETEDKYERMTAFLERRR